MIKEGNSTPVGYDEDIAYVDGELITSDSISFGAGGSQLDYYDPATLTEIKHVPVATRGMSPAWEETAWGGHRTMTGIRSMSRQANRSLCRAQRLRSRAASSRTRPH